MIFYLNTDVKEKQSLVKKNEQLNLRITSEMVEDLEDISSFLSVGIPELIRSWISNKINEYRHDERFESWRNDMQMQENIHR